MNFKSFACGIGLVGVLMIGSLNAADDSDCERDWKLCVTLRGGWLFGGKAKYSDHLYEPAATNIYGDRKKSLKSSWSGSGEFGVSLCDDRVFAGLELGYFAGKSKWEFDAAELARYDACPIINFNNGTYCIADGKYRNLFAAANVTLKKTSVSVPSCIAVLAPVLRDRILGELIGNGMMPVQSSTIESILKPNGVF